MLYSHVPYHYDTIIKTDAGRLLKQNMYLSFYCKGSKSITQGLSVRGSWRPNRNCNILTSTLMAVNVVSFSFSRCSTGGPGVHSAGCWLSLLHLISNFSGPQTPSGFPGAPSARCGFTYHTSSIPTPTPLQLAVELNCNWLELYSIFEIACLIVIKRK